MDTDKNKKVQEFLEDPEAWVSDRVEITMNRSAYSYAKAARSLGMNRDALYKFANRQQTAQNIQGYRERLLMIETGDLTLLVETAAMFGLELVPAGTMEALKNLPDALKGPHEEDRHVLYARKNKDRGESPNPMLGLMMVEATKGACK